jgi:hypothetical protein
VQRYHNLDCFQVWELKIVESDKLELLRQLMTMYVEWFSRFDILFIANLESKLKPAISVEDLPFNDFSIVAKFARKENKC